MASLRWGVRSVRGELCEGVRRGETGSGSNSRRQDDQGRCARGARSPAACGGGARRECLPVRADEVRRGRRGGGMRQQMRNGLDPRSGQQTRAAQDRRGRAVPADTKHGARQQGQTPPRHATPLRRRSTHIITETQHVHRMATSRDGCRHG